LRAAIAAAGKRMRRYEECITVDSRGKLLKTESNGMVYMLGILEEEQNLKGPSVV
jgi:hypothetical protein